MRIFQSTVKHGASAPGWVLVFLCVVALLSVSCSHRQQADPAEAEGGVFDMSDDLPNGLRMSVREAPDSSPSIAHERQVAGEPLSEAAIDAIYERVEALPEPLASQVDFALRSSSKPAPRAGQALEQEFPPQETSSSLPGLVSAKNLSLQRYQPEGDVELAPKVSLTFSQSVVPLTGHHDASKIVPARISPALEGTWRWVGTQTAIFDPQDGRFPMASEFTVTPNDALASTSGQRLEDPRAWTFRTPTVQIQQSLPAGEGNVRTPVFVLQFDQRVDADAILEWIEVEANGQKVEIVSATSSDIERDAAAKRALANAQDGRWVAFRTKERLPTAANVTTRLLKGAPSAEGPRTTPRTQERSFRTFDALKVTYQSCEKSAPCAPNGRWFVNFSNPLDEDAFDAKQVTVTPEVSNLEVHADYGRLSLRGNFKARTTYSVRLDKSLQDTHGQTLAHDTVLSFHIGEAPQMLGAATDLLTTLDPALQAKFPFYHQNYDQVRVRAWSVTPEDWSAYLEFVQKRNEARYSSRQTQQSSATPPGTLAWDETLTLEHTPDELTETLIDLQRALNAHQKGHVILQVQGVDNKQEPQRGSQLYRMPYVPEILTWIQVTDLSLHASWDGKQMLAWTAQLSNGAPIEGAEVRVAGRDNASGRTDASGVTRIDLNGSSDAAKAIDTMLIAQKKDDVALLPERQHAYSPEDTSTWRHNATHPHVLAHVLDDRGIYQPGEEVHVKGWVRYARAQRDETLRIPSDANATYTVMGPRRNTLAEGKVSIDKDGAFDLSFSLPDDVNLGFAQLTLRVEHADLPSGAQSIYHGFQIQEFRRPEFEVNVSKSNGPFVVGERADVQVNADYYAGGSLSGAPVRWTLESNEGRYTPPNQHAYSFGRWSPWWWWGPGRGQSATLEHFDGTTDARGEHRISLAFEGAKPALPMTLSARAAVQDVNRQTWQASTELLIHPSDRYVGLRTEKNFVEEGKAFSIESLVTDIYGAVQAGHAVQITASRLDWQYKNGSYNEVETDTLRCEVQSKDRAQPCEFKPKKAGAWLVRATVYDDLGRPNMSELRVWVGNQAAPPNRRAQQQEVRLIPDQESYKVGDTATLMMLAPFENAEALITVRQAGIVTYERVVFEGDTHTFSWTLTEKDMPNIGVQVDLVGETPRVNAQGKALKNAAKRPAWASGSIQLRVPPDQKELHIDLAPEDESLSPGDATHVNILVKDANGHAMKNAHVALIVVDEAILALTNYTLRHPLESFYPDMADGVQSMDLHAFLVLAMSQELLANDAEGDDQVMYDADSLGMGGAAPQMMARSSMMKSMATEESADAAAGGGSNAGIDVRQNFNPLAVFAARTLTDADGRARVAFDLPDNLTRYRIMAVASRGAEQFGKAEKNITAQLPLMVRPSPPRFLNYGDQLDIPVVVQNQTDRPLAVDVVARASNLTLLDPMGQRVQVPANDRVEVRFSARADKAGTAHLQVVATSGTFADAATQSFPVWTPATTEAFATYGTLDGASEVKRQPVVPPTGVIQDFGALEVTTSSSAVQSLTDALIYLVGYPFESAEHIASRILGVTALTPVLSAFESENLPKEEALKQAIERDLEKLARLQRGDGGFYLWAPSERMRFVFAEVHVVHALLRAQKAGYNVAPNMLQRAQRFLQNIENALPTDYSAQTKNTVRAYAFYVRNLAGEDVQKDVRALSQKTPQKELSLEAIGWILSTLHADHAPDKRTQELTRFVENLTEETAATAQFTTAYSENDNYVLMHSSRRTDAVLLEAWMHTQPQSDLIPKIVRGLESHRSYGRWLNTQENAFVLLALQKYFETYEKSTPDFVANLWLGNDFAGSHTFKGRTLDYQHTNIPMKAVVDAHDQRAADLTLQKLGKGRLYYRLGMRYALESLELEAAEHGFAVTRTYEGLDDPNAVSHDEDGTWDVRLGERVRVRVTMVVPARRHHVALVDKLPAGFEALNPELAVTESLPKDADSDNKVHPFWWGFARWYTHQNLRDERAEAFATLLNAGVYEYTYTVRATTPGTFVVPPAKAEEMYYPETFGRTSSNTIRVQ